MLKKTVTYKDFNEEEVTEDLYFNLTRAEIIELELSHEGGISGSMQRLLDAADGNAIMKEIKSIIFMAYGQRSSDGKRFIKNQQLREEFESSMAYDALFISLVTNADYAAEFVNGIIPTKMIEQMNTLVSDGPKTVLAEVPRNEPDKVEVITRAKVMGMTDQEFKALAERLRIGDAVLSDD